MPRPVQPLGTFGTITAQKKGGVYYARARYRGFDGVYRRLQASATTRQTAIDELKVKIANFVEDDPAGDLTSRSRLREAAELWLEDIVFRDKLTQQSIDGYREAVERFILPVLGDFQIRELTVGRLDRFLKSLAQRSPARARQTRTVLSQIFGLLVRHDAVATNPVAGTSPVPLTRSKVRALSIEELALVRRLIASWRTGPNVHGPKPDGQLPLIFDVILGTSARIGEAVALRVCDVDLDVRPATVTVSGTLVRRKGGGPVRQNHPKHSKRWRIVSVPGFTAEAIRQRLDVVGDSDPEQPIFCTKHGTWLSPANVRRIWRDIRNDLDGELPDGVDLTDVTRTRSARPSRPSAIEPRTAVSTWLPNSSATARQRSPRTTTSSRPNGSTPPPQRSSNNSVRGREREVWSPASLRMAAGLRPACPTPAWPIPRNVDDLGSLRYPEDDLSHTARAPGNHGLKQLVGIARSHRNERSREFVSLGVGAGVVREFDELVEPSIDGKWPRNCRGFADRRPRIVVGVKPDALTVRHCVVPPHVGASIGSCKVQSFYRSSMFLARHRESDCSSLRSDRRNAGGA